jgi:hypothetical protein
MQKKLIVCMILMLLLLAEALQVQPVPENFFARVLMLQYLTRQIFRGLSCVPAG